MLYFSLISQIEVTLYIIVLSYDTISVTSFFSDNKTPMTILIIGLTFYSTTGQTYACLTYPMTLPTGASTSTSKAQQLQLAHQQQPAQHLNFLTIRRTSCI